MGRRHRTTPARSLTLCALALTLTAACGNGTSPAGQLLPPTASPVVEPTASSAPTTPGAPSPTAPTTTTTPPATTATTTSASPRASAPDGATLSESDAGKTVTVPRGSTVTLVLHSTYWTIDGSSDRNVLSPEGAQESHPASPGACLPGVGCGTVSERFGALRDGTARLTASRSTCGEALACRPDQRTYSVTVRVTA